MAEIANLAHARRRSEVSRSLAKVARAMATNCLTVELALERHDWDSMNDAAETVLELAALFREQRRVLLAAGRPV